MHDEDDRQLPLFATTRSGDPETSYEAAAIVTAEIRESQLRVLACLRRYGAMTDRALVARMYPMSPSGVRSRRSELTHAGLVTWTGKKELIGRTHHRIWMARAYAMD